MGGFARTLELSHRLLRTYPVADDATEAAGFEIGGVPVALLLLDERPHDAPLDHASQEDGGVDEVRADHPDAHVRRRKVEEEPAGAGNSNSVATLTEL